MSEPTTEAGKALLRSDFDTTAWGARMVREHVTRAVLAIEADARAPLQAQIERLRDKAHAVLRDGDVALAALDRVVAENARLRKTEEAAREHGVCTCEHYPGYPRGHRHAPQCDDDPILRAALGEERR